MNTAITALLAFFIVVVVHEFGHFITAKLADVKVHEFAIGMGPQLTKFKKGETEYTLRLLPIGGFVRMEGEDEHSTDTRSFNNKSPLQRMMILAAGAIMNFFLAFIIFFIVSYSVGVATTTIEDVIDDYPASSAGLIRGDQIIGINGEEISSWDEFKQRLNEIDSGSVSITINRKGVTHEFVLRPIVDKNTGLRVIGIQARTEKSILAAIQGAFTQLLFILSMMANFFKKLVVGNVAKTEVAGPIGVIQLIGQATQYGVLNVMSLIGLISINLGFFNLLPVPALDGGRLFFVFIELLRGKPISPEKEGFVHFLGFVVLMLLLIVVSYQDIIRLNLF